jgi:hypothetical protein
MDAPAGIVRIAQPRSWLLPALVAVLLPLHAMLVLSFAAAARGGRISLAVHLLLAALLAWMEYVRGRRVVTLDPAAGTVTVVQPGILLVNGASVLYPLSDFRGVISYLTPLRHALNRVELVDWRSRTLLLAAFEPASDAPRFLAVPDEAETPAARELRRSVAAACRIADGGYLGHRMWGAEVPSGPIS